MDGARGLQNVPKHLILPKSASRDVRSLLRLDTDQLRALRHLFATPESIPPTSTGFIQKVAEQLHLDTPGAKSIVVVCQFLLTVVEEGHPASEIVDDIREFVAQADPAEERDVVTTLDSKRNLLESLLTPAPERSRALKIRYLREIHPMVDSFRTVCELRPVFDRIGHREQIVGYVPTILLEATLSDDEEERVLLHLSANALKALGDVVRRTEEKLEAIRLKFGNELLGETTKE
jgi:hypothetical protein